MIFPPIGFLGSAANMAAPSTCATTWLVITTATPNCKEKSNKSKSIYFPQCEQRKRREKQGKKKREEKNKEERHACTSAALPAVHSHFIMHPKTKWKQTLSRQKAICTTQLSFTRESKLITSPLETKAKFTVYLICKSKKHTQKSGQMHLSSWQLTSSRVICPIKGCGTVHYQQRVSGEVQGSHQHFQARIMPPWVLDSTSKF